MASWFVPIDDHGNAYGATESGSLDRPEGSIVEGSWTIFATPENCTGWRWPARLAEVEPVEGRVQFWSPHTGNATTVRILGVVDGMALWGPGGRGVISFARRAAALTDEQTTAIARVWLKIPAPARRSSLAALRKTIDGAGRGGGSVAARALTIDSFTTPERHLGRRVGEPARAALRATASCLIVRDVVADARSGLTQKGFDLLTSPFRDG